MDPGALSGGPLSAHKADAGLMGLQQVQRGFTVLKLPGLAVQQRKQRMKSWNMQLLLGAHWGRSRSGSWPEASLLRCPPTPLATRLAQVMSEK